MNFSTIPLLYKVGITAVSTVTALNPLSTPTHTLRNTAKSKQAGIPYVAFGDSLTTGSSIASCLDNRKASPWGCTETPTAAVPYPDRVARASGYRYTDSPEMYKPKNLHDSPVDLYRSGIWGYTIKEAAQSGSNHWMSQLEAISRASQLVTGSLGINDLHFSNIGKWLKLYLKPGADRITPAVEANISANSADFDRLFTALEKAKDNGASVIVSLYYNPYDVDKPSCSELKDIGSRIVDPLDSELTDRAHQAGFGVADFRWGFQGHGAGSEDSYVFGTECSVGGLLSSWFSAWAQGGDPKKAISIAFDPHPNNKGTVTMAQSILREYNNAD
ncbi:MAG: hypothetical protein ABIQ89_04135 [Candidatus Saccharimonadales bacterium]